MIDRPARAVDDHEPALIATLGGRLRDAVAWEVELVVGGAVPEPNVICHSERSRREAQAEARNRDRPEREAPLPHMIAIPRLRAFGAPLGMTAYSPNSVAWLCCAGGV